MVLIDSHCHVFMPEFDPDRAEVLLRARRAGICRMMVIGYDLPSSRQAAVLAAEEEDVFACVAVHPHHATEWTPAALEELSQIAAHPKVVGVGETGLDYYRNRSPRSAQETAFRDHLRLARDLRLPVVIHDRDAHADTLRILEAESGGLPAVVLHCFSGDRAMADRVWSLGYYTGIAGPVTYPNGRALRELLRDAPRDRVLLETDAPYLPPTPHRGKRNEPAYLPLAAEAVAATWQVSPEMAAALTTANACRAFALPLPGADG